MRLTAALCNCFVFATLLISMNCAAQDAPPGTDIWLLDAHWSADGLTLDQPRNITARSGYDNQPMFSPDGNRIWYTRMDDQGVTDVWFYDLGIDAVHAFTRTQTSEYSPTPTPDNQGISVIRVIDGKQWLYKLPLDSTQGHDELLLPEVEPVGYHSWLSDNELALFVLGEPHTLQMVKLGQPARVAAENIGRGLKRKPGSNLATYIDASSEQASIRLANPKDDSSEELIKVVGESQDFAWSDSGWLLMGQGSVLWGLSPGQSEWQKLADLSQFGIHDISRIAIAPGGKAIALVGTDPPPE